MLFRNSFVRTLIGIAAITSAAAAVAEVYTWKDATGRVHYSDQPPPNVDAKPTKPTSAPRYAPAVADSPAQSDARPQADPKSDSKPLAAQSGPKSWQEKELDAKQRRAAEQEAETKRKQEESKAEEKKRYCESLRNNLAMYERGGRITSTNANGERIFLEDAQIKQETERTRAQLARDCSK